MTENSSEIVYQVGAPPQGPPPARKRSKAGWIIGLAVGIPLAVCLTGAGLVAVGSVLTAGAGSSPSTSPSSVPLPTPASTAAPTTAAPATAAPTTSAPDPAVPADTVYSGKGDKVLKLAKLSEDHIYLAAITYTGSSNFAIISRGEGGDYIDLLVNEIGKYSGVRPLTLEDYPLALEIKASGAWKIRVFVASKAPRWAGTASGKGDSVFVVSPGTLGNLASVKVTHTGSSNFVVRTYGGGSDLLINEIGRYSGEVLMSSDAVLIEIVADGAWTIKAM